LKREVNLKPVLFIDLDKCRNCKSCKVPCSYRLHSGNSGIQFLRELAEFTVTCRKCEAPPCVKSCPSGALERRSDGVPVRNVNRCVACKSCCYACPFGVVLPDLMRLTASACDFCEGRLNGDEPPVCTKGCGENAVQYGLFEPDPRNGRFPVGDRLVVSILPWKMETAR
jgi:Fe-S-cluster-containing dehydrogenase component